MTGSSTQGIKTVLHPVSDLATAKAVYAALLGVPPQTDGSYYVGFEAEGQHIGLVPGRARRGCRPPGGHRHRPRWQRPQAASGPMTADPSLPGWPVPRRTVRRIWYR